MKTEKEAVEMKVYAGFKNSTLLPEYVGEAKSIEEALEKFTPLELEGVPPTKIEEEEDTIRFIWELEGDEFAYTPVEEYPYYVIEIEK